MFAVRLHHFYKTYQLLSFTFLHVNIYRGSDTTEGAFYYKDGPALYLHAVAIVDLLMKMKDHLFLTFTYGHNNNND